MEFYNSGFSKIIIEEKTKTIYQVFFNTTSEMSDAEFRKDMEKMAIAYRKYPPKKVLVNQENFNFTIEPSTQEWISNEVAYILVELETEKVAFVLSKEIFAQISVQMTMEEEVSSQLTTHYFETETEAREWLEI